jgi:phage head maturation protease
MSKDQETFFTFSPTVTERDAAGLPKRFSGIAYTGGVIPNYGWHGDAIIDMTTLVMPEAEIFALVDHDPTKRAGRLTAELSGGQVIVNGTFFTNEAGNEVAKLFSEGAPWQMSLGVMSERQSFEIKTPVTVNGGNHAVNTVFKNTTLREVSFVPVGADPKTAVAAFAAASSPAQGGKPTGDTKMELDELKAKVAELSAALDAEKAARVDAESKLANFAAVKRDEGLAEMAKKMGRALTEPETMAFKGMDEGSFAIVLSAIPAKSNGLPAGLGAEQATSGNAAPADDGKKSNVINMAAIYAARSVK